MTVIVLQKAPDYLRGELTRYLYEISNGVYAGEINAKIRELLWNKIEKTEKNYTEISLMSFNGNGRSRKGIDYGRNFKRYSSKTCR